MTIGGCHCGYVLPSPPRLDIAEGVRRDAEVGDFHVCPACATVLILDVGGKWRPAQISEIFAAAPLTRRMIAAVVRATETSLARDRRLAGHGIGGMVN